MTVSSQICKRIYQADGENRQWAVDFPYLSAAELKVYVTDSSGIQTDVTAQCVLDTTENEIVYPTVASEQDPLPTGSSVTIVRATAHTQSLHLTQQGTLDASAIEGGFDKLTLQVQELAEQATRCIKYPVSSNETDADAQSFLAQLQSAQTQALNGALESVAATESALEQALSDEETSRQQADAALQTIIATKQNALNTDGQQAVSSGITAAKVSSYDTHLLNTNNPHAVTKAQVGLGNVDNTADIDKPISTAVQSALDGKQNTGDYATNTALNTGLAAKQDALNATQLLAVNSGVSSATVAQVQTNKENIAALDAELDLDRPWQKPADWVDIRSMAEPESVYFLVAHSVPTVSEGVYSIATYPEFALSMSTSSGKYDVYVDNILVATTNSGSNTTIDFETLYNNGTLVGGYDVTYPSTFTTHIIRATPHVSGSTVTAARTYNVDSVETGLLWAHFTTSGFVSLQYLGASATLSQRHQYLCEAITCSGESLKVSSLEQAFTNMKALATLPVLEGNNNDIKINRMLFFDSSALRNNSLKEIVFKNMRCYTDDNNFAFYYAYALKRIRSINSSLVYNTKDIGIIANIEKIDIPVDYSNMSGACSVLYNVGKYLTQTIFDLSKATGITRLQFNGTSSSLANGKVGLIVSNEAPFNYQSSPQIDARYTNMSRAALVNLFKSMPYNVGYTVVGSPTISNGIYTTSSSSSYLKSSSFSAPFNSATQKLEFGTDITTSSTVQSSYSFMQFNGTIVRTGAAKKLLVYFGNTQTLESTTVLSANTNYKIKVIVENGVASLYVAAAGGDYTLEDSAEVSFESTYDLITLGRQSSSVWLQDASMNLNNTYIKIDGVSLFSGNEAMTKTISVVGCTGTADLTADDKAIAEDKGWAITLS